MIAAALATIFAAAILNRIAGGGYNPWPTGEDGDWLLDCHVPGRAIYWIAPMIGLLAWCWLPVTWAAALAFAYFVWRLPSWGPYLDMDRAAIWGPVRDDLDRAIRKASFGSQRLAMFWRMAATAPAVIPLAWLTACWSPPLVMPMALWLAYEAGWQGYDREWWGRPNDGGVPAAEHIAGALWGALIVGVALWTY